MLRLFVLLTVVVCCNASCRIAMLPTQYTTNSPQGCADSEGSLHELHSEWEEGKETCVCVEFATICCERFEGHWAVTDHDYIAVADEGFEGHWEVTDHDYITVGDEGYDDSTTQPTADEYVAEDTESEK